MDKQVVGFLMEAWRRWDFMMASILMLFSLVFWLMGQRLPQLRALRWGVSASEDD